MRHFATESGKSKGQFYTPSEVSRIMAKIIGVISSKSKDTSAYDPTAGSASLLIKVNDESNGNLSLYGQEMDVATASLARMNMILHNCPGAMIVQGNTLANPKFLNGSELKKFDYFVSNPPFSFSAWMNGLEDPINDPYSRFKDFGIPPAKNGDYAFLLHAIQSLKPNGKGAIILPHGVLFRGNAEAEIRKNLIQRGYIKGIIGLPANLFYGTGIPACIIIIDKEKVSERKGLFIIDASKGFAKDGNKNRLREQDIHKIVDTFNKQIEIHKYSRFVLLKEIQEKEYNLNIPRYIDNSEDEDIHDIHAHLYGGIPSYDIDSWDEVWESFPSLKETLFQKIKGKDYYSLKVSKDEIKASVLSNADFQAFEKKISSKFLKWKKDNLERCKSLDGKSIPKQFILELSESFLGTFKNIPLIDAYDIYQHLMTYWYDTMQDDIHLIVGEGWKGGKTIFKNEKTKEFEGIMLPSSLVIAQYFQKEKKAIDALITKKEEIAVKLEELVEEHSTEDGLLSEAKNENDSINKNSVTNRLKKIKGNKEFKEEIALLETYLDLSGEDSELSKQIKESTKKLMDTVEVKYSSFKEDEIQKFIIEDKWFATLTSKVEEEIKRLSQKITGKITLLSEYYESPLKEQELELEKLEEKVNQHLKVMGF